MTARARGTPKALVDLHRRLLAWNHPRQQQRAELLGRLLVPELRGFWQHDWAVRDPHAPHSLLLAVERALAAYHDSGETPAARRRRHQRIADQLRELAEAVAISDVAGWAPRGMSIVLSEHRQSDAADGFAWPLSSGTGADAAGLLRQLAEQAEQAAEAAGNRPIRRHAKHAAERAFALVLLRHMHRETGGYHPTAVMDIAAALGIELDRKTLEYVVHTLDSTAGK